MVLVARSVYVTSVGSGGGKSTIALGLAELLSRQVERVGAFRPFVDRAFRWYLDQAAPSYAAAPTGPALAASGGTQSRTPSHSLP